MGLARRDSRAASVVLSAAGLCTEELHAVVALGLCTYAGSSLCHEHCACAKQSNGCYDKASNQNFVHTSPPVWVALNYGRESFNVGDGMVANYA